MLRAAQQHGPIRVENKTVMLFPDYSRAVQRQRASFLYIKRRLRAAQVQYSLLFPARLKVIHKGTTCFFMTPEEAQEWADQHCAPAPRAEWAPERGTGPAGSRRRRSQRRKGQGTRGLTPRGRGSPDLEQIMQEQRKALRAARSLRPASPGTDIERAPHLFSSEEEGGSDTTQSGMDSANLPRVTPQTADDIM